MKSVTSVVWSVIISMAFAGSCLAGAITLPWSNNLNCSAWTYNGSSETITSAGCKEFTAASDAGACGTYAQITAAANNGNIDSSGVGIRQYVGSATGSTGQTEATDGFVVTLPNPTKINIRWYERYQAGFQWSTISHHKDVYVWTATGAQYIIPTPMYSATQYVVGTYSGGQNYNLSGTIGNFISPGDGKWHLYELHATQSGTIQMWVDEVLIISSTVPAFDSAFNQVQFGSNIASANNRTCAAIDYDDLAITAGTYIGPASGGGGGGSTDTTPPTVTAFVMPATSTSLTVAVTSFKASDNVAVTGYCLTSVNSSSGCQWSASAPASYTFSAQGAQTLYAWAKDAAGNVSSPSTASVTIGSATPPVISNVSPSGTQACATNPLNVTLSLSTNVAATCKLNATDTAYGSMKYTFSTTGGTTHSVPLGLSCGTTYTYYVRCADAAGNASTSSTVATIPVSAAPARDTTPPAISAFAMPATSSSLTVPVTALQATDNVGVTGFCLTTSNSSSACSWSASAPSSYIFSAQGAQTLYAWARDAAGNVSSPATASVTITVSGNAPPVISNVSPKGTQACATNPLYLTLSLTTDKAATCKLNATDTAYGSMKYTFSTTGGTTHSVPLGLSCGVTYTYYVRCTDSAGNANTSSTVVTVPVSP